MRFLFRSDEKMSIEHAIACLLATVGSFGLACSLSIVVSIFGCRFALFTRAESSVENIICLIDERRSLLCSLETIESLNEPKEGTATFTFSGKRITASSGYTWMHGISHRIRAAQFVVVRLSSRAR